jgi:glucose dehydrogenase
MNLLFRWRNKPQAPEIVLRRTGTLGAVVSREIPVSINSPRGYNFKGRTESNMTPLLSFAVLTTVVLTTALVPALEGQTDWPTFGHDPGGQRFSPLKQIDAANVSKLKLAWSYDTEAPPGPELPVQQGQGGRAGAAGASGAAAASRARQTEAIPLVIGNVLYLSTAYNRVVALEADTGKEIWVYQTTPDEGTPGMRGVNYWPGDRQSPAEIVLGTTNGKMLALNAKTGKLVPGFGTEGEVDLRKGVADKFPNARYYLSSPPQVYKNTLITGANNGEGPAFAPAGDPRGWDARTGKLLWSFHTIPQPGELNHDTWLDGQWENRGGANAWGFISVDVERGIVYVPLGSANTDFWGGDRKGPNLYGATLVALDANTGKMKWYFQATHHDNWDYDLPPAPLLLTVNRNGQKIPAVAQYGKTGLLFILDRLTGKPIFGVEERPVVSDNILPGDEVSPTQPFPVKPPALTRNTFSPNEVSTVTPEHEAFCKTQLAQDGGVLTGGPYAQYGPKMRVVFPSVLGGGNFGGISYSPDLGYIFANAQNLASMAKIEPNGTGGYRRLTAGIPGDFGEAPFWWPEKRWPCQQPPWGVLSAVNASTGDIAWQVPLGEFDELTAKGVPKTGTPNMGGSIATAGGLVFIGATIDNKFRAFDAKTGKELWKGELNGQGQSIPITFQGANGKQYVAIVASGGSFLRDPPSAGKLFVYSLP